MMPVAAIDGLRDRHFLHGLMWVDLTSRNGRERRAEALRGGIGPEGKCIDYQGRIEQAGEEVRVKDLAK